MKYTGSKARLSKEICDIINEQIVSNKIETYIEPFVGGANIIENVVCKNKIASDNNGYLIALWKALIEGYSPPDFIDKETYHKVKENRGSFDDVFVGLCGICASYNGNWFSSYGGYSSTKTGKDRNYYSEALKNIYKQLPKLKDVEFKNGDYADYSSVENCLFYCDPPYAKNKKVYDDKGFDHIKFWEWVRKMSEKNIVIVSEYEAPEDFDIIFEKQLSIMFPKQKKNTPPERLFKYNKIIVL